MNQIEGVELQSEIVNKKREDTWGAGRDGRLGHGDAANRAAPARVEAFDGRCVLLALGPVDAMYGGYASWRRGRT